MNIFLGVYACEPNNGSEPEVGWQMVNQIAKKLPDSTIYAITKKNNKKSIESVDYPNNIKFFYYEPPRWLTFWKKGGRGIRTYYYLWSIGAALYMKKQNIKFDIVHHITFVNDWLPSFYFLLKSSKETKFIWGPNGSNDPISFKFLDTKKLKIQEVITNLLKIFFRNLDPFFHICKYKSDCIIGINKNVKSKLNITEKYFIAEPAIAVEKSFIEKCEINKTINTEFTLISVGRLVHIKNFKLIILSYNKFLKNNPDIKNSKLIIVGDGPDKEMLKKLTSFYGIESNVDFIGKVPLNDVQKHLSKSSLFFFPTLENAGFVTIEAMANSLPVLAMKYGGPEQFVINNREEQLVNESLEYDMLIGEFAAKIEYFYNNKEIAIKIGKQNKLDILENFTWEAKAEKMIKLYKELLNEKN